MPEQPASPPATPPPVEACAADDDETTATTALPHVPSRGSPLDDLRQKMVDLLANDMEVLGLDARAFDLGAVVDALGAETAYGLLDATERIQAQGGMVVPDTGRPRTSGGIFYRLLKEATNLPREAQDAALQCIKTEGKRVKSWEKGVAPGGW
jgi:hypothetical protein